MAENVVLKGDNWDFAQNLYYLAAQMKVNMLVDPRASTSSSYQQPFSPRFESQPATNILHVTLSGRGLTYRVQGGLIFITKEEKELPSPP